MTKIQETFDLSGTKSIPGIMTHGMDHSERLITLDKFHAKTDSGLTESQLASFNCDGFLIIPDALPPSTVQSLLAETHSMLDNFSLEGHPMTKFKTRGDDHVGDDYFLTSGDKIRFFFEEDAFDASGNLTKPKAKAINKIGHYLHVLSPPFASLLGSSSETSNGASKTKAPDDMLAKPAAIARSLGFQDPRCLQSMVICKQAEIGGAVRPHQDSQFLYTEAPSAVGFWYALEDATLENGCLSFLPGSHKWAPISQRLVRKPGGTGTEMVPNQGSKFPPGDVYGEKDSVSARDEDYVAGEVKAGSLVLIHGNLLHKSEKNLSQKGRIIYTFHIIEGGDGRKYDEKNWLQPPNEGFTRLYT